MGSFAEIACHHLGKLDTASYRNEVDVLGRTSEEKVTDTSPYSIAGATDGIGRLAYGVV